MLSLLKKAVLVSLPLTISLELNNSHTSTLDNFQVFTQSNLQLLLPRILSDVIPTRLCKIVLTNGSDSFIALIILTLQYFPNQLKQCVVRPLIKKFYLDPELLSSYRPVTKLRFISKVIGRVVFEQFFKSGIQ